jgi:hypothetical protein
MLWTTLAFGQVVDVEHVALRLPPSALLRIVRSDTRSTMEGRFQLVADSTIVLQAGRLTQHVPFSAVGELWVAGENRSPGALRGALIGAFGGGLAAAWISKGYCRSSCVESAIQPTIAGVAFGGLVGLLAGSVLGGRTYTWVRRVP